MKFTLQDLWTFLIGLVVAVVWEVGNALVTSADAFEDFNKWLALLAVGILTAAGRYILTYLTQRGLTH